MRHRIPHRYFRTHFFDRCGRTRTLKPQIVLRRNLSKCLGSLESAGQDEQKSFFFFLRVRKRGAGAGPQVRGAGAGCGVSMRDPMPPRQDELLGRKKGETYLVEYKELQKDMNLLPLLEPVWKFLGKELLLQHPKESAIMHYLSSFCNTLANKHFFQAAALNKHPCLTSIHSDADTFITTLFWGGDFSGGRLVIPQLNLKLEVRPGDIY